MRYLAKWKNGDSDVITADDLCEAKEMAQETGGRKPHSVSYLDDQDADDVGEDEEDAGDEVDEEDDLCVDDDEEADDEEDEEDEDPAEVLSRKIARNALATKRNNGRDE